MKFLLPHALVIALSAFIFIPAQAAENIPSVTAPVAQSWHVKGTVKAIAPDALTLSHEAVPELQWPPMTMSFALAKALVLPELAVGDPVDFDVSLIDGRYEIIALTVRH
ncbi:MULTISPECIES: copper-binding protein [Enterobacterales]|uniref:copper-binding protein n=1 Tax=Enterobacterales TaxID=91347 RepID=UPI002EDB2B5F